MERTKILVADDDAIVRSTVTKILEISGHRVETADDGRSVIASVDESFDVIILDINMPYMDGFETISALNALQLDIPVLFLTGDGSMDNVVKALNLGAYDFLTKPIADLDIFNVKIRRAIEKRMYVRQEKKYKAFLEDNVRIKAKQLEINNALLEQAKAALEHKNTLLEMAKVELEEKNLMLEQGTMQLMSSMQNAMEEKDYYTAGHTVRVTRYAVMLGEAIGLSEGELSVLRRAAQFHDIGKLAIDLSCIQKKGKLTEEEWKLIRKHPVTGENIIEPLGFMQRELFIIRHHHERIDGRGYPDGLTGDELCPLTKLLTVVDSYDAMTSKRNYRQNLSMDRALEELFSCSDTQFDKEIVDYFSKSIVDFNTTQHNLLFQQVN